MIGKPEMASLELSDWAVVACLALPHLLYAYIWFFPDRWMAVWKKSSVQVFENFAWALKGDDAMTVSVQPPTTG